MSQQALLDEWRELSEDYKNLEKTHRLYQLKLNEVDNAQKQCQKELQHQRYRMALITKKLPKEQKEEVFKREVQLQAIEETLPKTNDTYLRIILGSVNVSILNKEDKFRYKSEYEKFKLILSIVAFVLSVANLMVVFRALERVYLFLLVWYYCTLTIRESILKLNGSRIKGWWRMHHFLSMVTAAILLIWPQNQNWTEFRTEFMIFNAYLSLVQYLQFRYQLGVIYRLKALGEKGNMDVTVEGFQRWMWKGLSFLFPFLFMVYFFQLYMSYSLYKLQSDEDATWHVTVLSIAFFILSVGNITTTLSIIPDKTKMNLILKYRVLTQRLWVSGDEETKTK